MFKRKIKQVHCNKEHSATCNAQDPGNIRNMHGPKNLNFIFNKKLKSKEAFNWHNHNFDCVSSESIIPKNNQSIMKKKKKKELFAKKIYLSRKNKPAIFGLVVL